MKEPIETQELVDFVGRTECFCLDCDGVLWKGSELIPNVKETLDSLRKLNKRFFFITNNSTISRKNYLKKFLNFGIHAETSEILSSAYAASVYIKRHNISKVYVIGGDGIKEELEEIGVVACGFEEHLKKTFKEDTFIHEWEEFIKTYPIEEIGAVVVGYDNRFSNFKLAIAHQILKRNPKCLFVATNTDSTLPYKQDFFYPGGGTFVNCLATAIGRQPDIVAGKPSTLLIDTALSLLYQDKTCSVNPENRNQTVCMVGDRLETDIALGKQAGVQSVCVLTGVATREQISEIKQIDSSSTLIPDYLISDFAQFLKGTPNNKL
ncbi:hypothetical protein ABK040_001598 [Willaertia magna]